MIRIHRPAAAPPVLLDDGKKARRANCRAHTNDPAGYRSGVRSFVWYKEIYAHATVRQVLRVAQHDKCCFCETKVTHVAYGDIEHFRPKGGFRQQPTQSLGRPGYYWLAYEWANLLFSCQLCNQREKKNLFPLRDPSLRARSHRDPVRREEPLFIDPAAEDPEALIFFRAEFPVAVRGNVRGRRTIEALGLRRPELNQHRRDHLAIYQTLHRLTVGHPSRARRHEAEERLRAAIKDDAEYAGMMRAALAAWRTSSG